MPKQQTERIIDSKTRAGSTGGSYSTPDGRYVRLVDYEDGDVLAKVKNVDGAASGLDADLLDGQHAAAFAAASHTHDDRYYTEAEITTLLAGYATSGHNHDAAYISIVGSPTNGNFPTLTAGGELANSAYGPTSFAAAAHTHDDRYYTESEITTLLAGYALLAGRSGGQTLYGGTASGDDLYLRPTSHATKGDVIMDQGNVGIGTTPNAAVKLDVAGDVRAPSHTHRYDYVGTTFTSGARRIYFVVDTGGESPNPNYYKIATLRYTGDTYQGGSISGTIHRGGSQRGGKKLEFALDTSKGPGFNAGAELYMFGESDMQQHIFFKQRMDAGGSKIDYFDLYVVGGWYTRSEGWIDILSDNVQFDVWSAGYNAGTSAPAGTTVTGKSNVTLACNYFGINNLDPAYPLDVSGRSRFRSGAGGTAGFWLSDNSKNDRAFMGLHTDSASAKAGFYMTGTGGSAWRAIVDTFGNFGIGTEDPQGVLHTASGGGYHLFKTVYVPDGNAVTVIPDGTGDVYKSITFMWTAVDASGNVQASGAFVSMTPSSSVNSGNLTFAVTAGGAFTVARYSSSVTWTVTIFAQWM